jgi:hypothetical protein
VLCFGACYLGLFGVCFFSTTTETTDKIKGIDVLRDVIFCVVGESGIFYGKPILLAMTASVMIQMACYIPLLFYIAKEHLLQSIDEFSSASLSKMVDRIKGITAAVGDPRFFLVSRSFEVRKSLKRSEEESQNLIGKMTNVDYLMAENLHSDRSSIF